MQNNSADMERAADASQGQEPAAHSSRSAAAGREFLRAVGSDLAALTLRLRDSWRATAPRVARASLRATRASLHAVAQSMRPDAAAWGRASRTALRRFALRFGIGVGVVAIAGALAFAMGMVWALNGLTLNPPPREAEQPSLLLEAANGAPLGRLGPIKTPDTPLADFPPFLIKAVVSIEDHRFYHHFGVDPVGILRAARRNAQAGGIVEGGSTITQQLVKMRYVGDTRNYTRKLREAFIALWLETRLGKQEILRRYMDSVYLGAGAYGMAAAARLYFDKDPRDLTLAQAAMLAGLIQAPSQYNPLSHLDVAQARAATVLDAMVANGDIDARAAQAAKAQPAVPKLTPQLAPARSWFTDWVRTQAPAVIGPHAGSLRLRTTLMPDVQRLAQDILDKALAAQGRQLNISQGALVAMRPDGAVVAMVGGRDYGESQFNRAVAPNRQPGSSFKLFVYLTALRAGYTPYDTIDASPIDIKGWEPDNYGGAHYGRMTLADAFAHSVNTAAVRLAMDVGLDHVIGTARDLGIATPLSATPSLALGAYGVSLLDLTSAYGAVRADRMPLRPWGIAAVGEAKKDAALRATAPRLSGRTLGEVRDPMIELLRGVIEHGTGHGAALNGFAAGKTGTSQDYRDAWFIGFTDTLVVGVWLGNDDNAPMRRVVGGSVPATIWKQFMTQATPLVGAEGAQIATAQPAETTGQGDQTRMPQDDDQAGTNPAPQASSLCDVAACSSSYHSFRASDCTYQPYSGGARRACPLGAQSARATTQPGPGVGTTGAAPPASCNVDACERTYSSFDASDCTYQPYGGGARRLCEK
jgi:1A family penicillin-binding protein